MADHSETGTIAPNGHSAQNARNISDVPVNGGGATAPNPSVQTERRTRTRTIRAPIRYQDYVAAVKGIPAA